MINEKHIRKPTLRAKENERVPNALDYNKVVIELKERNEDNWIMSKHIPIEFFLLKNISM